MGLRLKIATRSDAESFEIEKARAKGCIEKYCYEEKAL